MSVNSYVDYPLTWRPRRERLKRPLYLSLATALQEDIERGILAPGIKLPSQRELADFLDISFTTVTKTYKLCEAQGIIRGEMGSGTFVSENANVDLTISKNLVSSSVIDLGFVSSIDQVTKRAIETIKKTIQVKYLEELLNYDNPSGMVHHKKTGIKWLSKFGVNVGQSTICITSGAQNALAIILLAIFKSGDTIIVDEYTYANFITLSRLCGIHLLSVKNDAFGMIPEELEKELRRSSAKGIFLMPSCANPTGVHMSIDRKLKLAKIIEKKQLLVIEDDVHAFLTAGFIEENYQTFYSMLPKQVFYISGLSKPLYSGLRVAFLAFPLAYKGLIEEALFNINVKTSSLETEIASQLIQSDKVEHLILEKKKILTEYHRVFDQIFPENMINDHPTSFYRWLKIDSQITSNFEDKLLDYGVRIFHSSRFFVGTKQTKSYLRVSLGSVNSKKELINGLIVLKKFLIN